jgi:hypothetical protein
MSQGIIYGLHGAGENRWGNLVSRGQVQPYHDKPHPLNISKGGHAVDIAGLKKKVTRDTILLENGEYGARFTIGFEIEKNALHRNAVQEYPLLCGFERDGSCGYEAVTHILPLLPASKWRNKVFDMFVQAEKIIDDRFSPSDKRCGGHVTIAVQGMSGDELREAIRKNCGILLALFRKRLTNGFCSRNRRMQTESEVHLGQYSETGGWHEKYQVALVKDKCLEFRLPSKVESVKQLLRRYELLFEMVNFTINCPNGSHEALLKRVRPIVKSMYNGDDAKTDGILELARHFRKFILTGERHGDIVRYL